MRKDNILAAASALALLATLLLAAAAAIVVKVSPTLPDVSNLLSPLI
jgi:hypothetical protein